MTGLGNPGLHKTTCKQEPGPRERKQQCDEMAEMKGGLTKMTTTISSLGCMVD